MKNIKWILLLLICVCSLSVEVDAATPRVMVWDYEIEGDKVISGNEFLLHVTYKNTSNRKVSNLKLTVRSAEGEFLPIDSAGTAYLETMGAGEEKEFVFRMEAISGLKEKSYKLQLLAEYEGNYGTAYTVEEQIFIPVSLEQRLSMTDILVGEEDIRLADHVEVTSMVNNMGEGTLYNVTAKVFGQNLDTAESYIGNIESGQSKMVDLLTKAISVSSAGDRNFVIISYEDIKGNQKEEKFEIGAVAVSEPDYAKVQVVKESNDLSAVLKKFTLPAIGVVAIVLIICLFMKRHKRKKQILEEFS